MPSYTFRCQDCDRERTVMTGLDEASELELICTSCGGTMTRAPVLTLNVIGPASAARKARREAEVDRKLAKPCGHIHACRCSVRLKKENPFKQEIRRTHGLQDEE